MNTTKARSGASLPITTGAPPRGEVVTPPTGSVSVIVPFLDEAETLAPLHARLQDALGSLHLPYEILFIDDGSRDGGGEIAAGLAATSATTSTIRFTRNFGKAAALSAGIARAQGDVIITLDADLQDDPAEIPRFIEAIRSGVDVVCGWKQDRQDPFAKTWPSKVFNLITARAFGVNIHDINCGFKAYTRRAAKKLNLYGELHRFTPALLHGAGFGVCEIPVKHFAREHGVSKYGSRRMIKGLLDLSTVTLVTRYQSRPLHFFAMLGLPLVLLGSLAIGYLSVLWLLGLGPIGNRPLLLMGALFVMTGMQLLGTGLIAELLHASRLREDDKYVTASVHGRGLESPEK